MRRYRNFVQISYSSFYLELANLFCSFFRGLFLFPYPLLLSVYHMVQDEPLMVNCKNAKMNLAEQASSFATKFNTLCKNGNNYSTSKRKDGYKCLTMEQI